MRFSKASVKLSGNDIPKNPAPKHQIDLKSDQDLDKLRIAGRMTAQVLKKLSEVLAEGVTTKYLDEIAEKEILRFGAKPAFKGYRGFPATICVSINDELVHGIPDEKRFIKNGDIVSIDIGLLHDGFYGDTACTYAAGKISPDAARLLKVTGESLDRAIEQVKPGNRLGDLAYAVQSFAESNGFSVIRDYVGHGIGRKLHEDPQVPNFGKAGTGIRLLPGMVIAIEPMISAGGYEVKTLKDGWTVVTADSRLCAHFEHMVAVTESGFEVLTSLQ